MLLVLDEAQALRPDVLALLPMLTNFNWDSGAPLAVLLAGQSGLRQTLRRAHLESLAQRLSSMAGPVQGLGDAGDKIFGTK